MQLRLNSTALVGAFVALAIATGCASSDSDSDSEPAEVTTGVVKPEACKDATLNFIGIAGEEGKAELASYRRQHNVKLQVNNSTDWGQVVGAIRVGQQYDLNTFPVLEAQRMIRAGVVQPIDTDRLRHWDDVVPALRESEAIRDADGKIYGVPILWGDGPYVYAPDRVPNPPTSIAELLSPEWKGRYTMFDDPGLPFFMLAQSLGYEDSPNLTMDQFEKVKGEVEKLVENAAAFQASYQDATDRLVAGDIDLAIGGWEAMLNFAQEKGATLDYEFFEESKGGGYWDGLAIPTTAKNPECSLAYIDQLIAPKANAKLATNLTSGAANGKAQPFLGEAAKIYDYDAVQSPEGGLEFVAVYPPEEAKQGYASLKDWQDAWAEIKAR